MRPKSELHPTLVASAQEHVKSPGPLRPYPALQTKFAVAVGKWSGDEENTTGWPKLGAAIEAHDLGTHVGAAPFHDAALLPDAPGTLHVRVLLPLSVYPFSHVNVAVLAGYVGAAVLYATVAPPAEAMNASNALVEHFAGAHAGTAADHDAMFAPPLEHVRTALKVEM